MSYQPSLNDLPEEGYTPSFNDIPSEEELTPPLSATQNILQQVNAQKNEPRYSEIPQITSDLGFAAGFIQPELGAARFAGLLPDALSRAGTFAANMGLKTGYNAADLAAQQMGNNNDPLDASHLANAIKNNLGISALMTAPEGILRGVGGLAETFNPEKYADIEKGNIQDAYQDAVKRQKDAYEPVHEKYGETNVTNNPGQFLNFDPNDAQYFTPNVKRAITTFNNDSTFDNLHALQSRMFKDSLGASTQEQQQALNYSRDLVNKKLEGFLGSDQPMLNSYLKGREITRNEVSPFQSNNVLQDVINGKGDNVSPNELTSALQDAIKKNTPNNTALAQTSPINNHYLSQALQNMQAKTDQAKVMSVLAPTALGAGAGEYFMPHAGVGAGIGAGVGAGIGAGLLKAGFKGLPGATEIAQNPWLVKALQNKVSPIYYGGSRAIIGQ